MDGRFGNQKCYIYLCNNSSSLVRYRALIFPFLIRQGKPTPFFTFLLALLFCIYNGYLQGRSLSNYAEYPSGWLKDPCFITGELRHCMRALGVEISLCLHSFVFYNVIVFFNHILQFFCVLNKLNYLVCGSVAGSLLMVFILHL